MELIWDRDNGILQTNGKSFDVICHVRNEIDPDYVRALHNPNEVVRSIVDKQWGAPYMPRKFPFGTWNINGIEFTTDRDFAPVKIKTDASQPVEVWALDKNGGYDHATGEFITDTGYHIHNSWSHTTRGCGLVGPVGDSSQVLALAKLVQIAIDGGEKISLIVG